MLRKIIFSLIMINVFTASSYAESILVPEAINYFNDGVKAQKQGDFVNATVNYQKALIMDPNNPNLQKLITNNYGIMYARQGDLDKAEAFFKEVIATDPAVSEAKLNLGLIIEKRYSRLESLEYWAKVFELDKLKPKDFSYSEIQKNN